MLINQSILSKLKNSKEIKSPKFYAIRNNKEHKRNGMLNQNKSSNL